MVIGFALLVCLLMFVGFDLVVWVCECGAVFDWCVGVDALLDIGLIVLCVVLRLFSARVCLLLCLILFVGLCLDLNLLFIVW